MLDRDPAERRAGVPWRGLAVYLAVSFAVSWALFGAVALVGGPTQGPALGFMGLAMFGPALGALAARAVGAEAVSLGVRRRGAWRWYLLAWLGVPVPLVLGAALCALAGVQPFDPSLSSLRQAAEASGQPFVAPPLVVALVGAAFAALFASWFNALFAFGEEVGWRGYLLGALLPLGPRRAALLVGAVWGVWHAPIVAQGWNFPGQPVLGPLAMIWFCLVWAVVFGWLRVRSGSVWPAALGHGALNAWAPSVLVFFGAGNPLWGLPAGLLAAVPALCVALWLLGTAAWNRAEPSEANGYLPSG